MQSPVLFLLGRRLVACLLLCAVVSLPGCTTFRYLPEHGAAVPVPADPPGELLKRTANVQATGFVIHQDLRMSQQVLEESLQRPVSSWFLPGTADPAELQVTIQNVREQRIKGIPFLFYMLTLGVFPGWSDDLHTSTMVVSSGGQEIFRNEKKVTLRFALSVFSPLSMLVGEPGTAEPLRAYADVRAAHLAALKERIAQEQPAFAAASKRGTAQAFEAFLAQSPNSFFRGEALRGLAATAARGSNPLAAHRSYAAHYPDYVRFLPANDALWFIGPVGLQVADIPQAIRRGTGAEQLASQIRAAGQPYKLFSAEELALLKRRGVPDAVATAMIDVTRQAGAAAPTPAPVAVAPAARPAPQANAALFGSLAGSTPAPAATAAMAAPAAAATPAPMSLGETVADKAGECAKALLAKKACEQIPDPTPFGLAIKACMKTVKKNYGGLGCPLI